VTASSPKATPSCQASQHNGFIQNMADLSCSLWGWEDTIGLTMMEQRIRFFAPGNIAAELLAADVPAPIAAAEAGMAIPARPVTSTVQPGKAPA